MKIKTLIAASLLALALVLAMTGCSKDSTTSSTPPTSTESSSTPTPTEPEESVTPTPTEPEESTTPDAPVLEGNPGALPAAHAAYAGMCAMCHNDNPTDPNQYPVAPTWKGSVKSPGPWTVVAGSPADHTGRTDSAGCVAAGCHS